MPRRLSGFEKFSRELGEGIDKWQREQAREQRRQQRAQEGRMYKRSQLVNKGYICRACDYQWISKKTFGKPSMCPNCRSRHIQGVEEKITEEKEKNLRLQKKEEEERIAVETSKRHDYMLKQKDKIEKLKHKLIVLKDKKGKISKKEKISSDVLDEYHGITKFFVIGIIVAVLSVVLVEVLRGFSLIFIIPGIGLIIYGVVSKNNMREKYPSLTKLLDIIRDIDQAESDIEECKDEIKETKNKDFNECLDDSERCPDCHSSNLGENEQGLTVCENCSCILEDN